MKKANPLAAIRRMAGLSQCEIAEKLNVRQTTYCRWECGQGGVTEIHLRNAVAVLTEIAHSKGYATPTCDDTYDQLVALKALCYQQGVSSFAALSDVSDLV